MSSRARTGYSVAATPSVAHGTPPPKLWGSHSGRSPERHVRRARTAQGNVLSAWSDCGHVKARPRGCAAQGYVAVWKVGTTDDVRPCSVGQAKVSRTTPKAPRTPPCCQDGLSRSRHERNLTLR